MPEQTFKAGDLVQLKSGGVNMTVDLVKLSPDQTTYVVQCVRFDNKKNFRESFMQESLKPYEPPTDAGFFAF